MRNRYLYITLLTVLGLHAEAIVPSLRAQPRLVVNIMIDQLSTEQLEALAPVYGNGGLKWLLQEGLVYSHASYDFMPVDRASALATIATGTAPADHGIIGAEWLDKGTLRPKNCISDSQYGYSPGNVLTSTLGDELKVATKGKGKVFAFAESAEAAILSAGHAADGVAWIGKNGWETSAYYRPKSSWLENYRKLYVLDTDVNKSITDIALNCVSKAGIGEDDQPDMITVVYPAAHLPEEGRNLDENIARLIAGIETRLSRERVLFVISGCGYRDEEEEDNERYRIPTGKFYINRTANLLNMYFGAIYGNARYVETIYKNQIFLNHQLFDQKNIDFGDVLRRAQEFILQSEGVRNVYTSYQLMTSDNSRLERIRKGFSVGKCGDLVIEIAPGWKLVNEDTRQTSTSRVSLLPFPIIFYGAGIPSGRVSGTVTADRIAPTIAKSIRIRAPNACSSEPLF